MSDQGTSNVSAEAKTQQWGYIRCYRAVTFDCGVMASFLYGILEDYAQIGAREHRPLMPSHKHLGTIMGVHRNTIMGLLNKLRKAGWIEWQEVVGQPQHYSLPVRRLHKKRAPLAAEPAQNQGTPCTTEGQPVAQKQGTNKKELNKTTEQDTPPGPPEGERTRKTRLPRDWRASDDELSYASDRGLDPDETEQEFSEHWWGNGEYRLDWHLVWQRWVREEVRRRSRLNGRHRDDPNATLIKNTAPAKQPKARPTSPPPAPAPARQVPTFTVPEAGLTNRQIWAATLADLGSGKDLSKAEVESWLYGAAIVAQLGDTLVIATQTTVARDRLAGRYAAPLRSALQRAAGAALTFRVITDDEWEEAPKPTESTPELAAHGAPQETTDAE